MALQAEWSRQPLCMAVKMIYNFLKGLFSSFPCTYINNNCISVHLCCKMIEYILDVEPAFYLQCSFRWSLESMFLLMFNLNKRALECSGHSFTSNWIEKVKSFSSCHCLCQQILRSLTVETEGQHWQSIRICHTILNLFNCYPFSCK